MSKHISAEGVQMDSNTWACPDCNHSILRNPDDPQSEAWTEQFIAGHEALHAQQLAEHDGDQDALRQRLSHPSRHAALTQLKDTEGGKQVDSLFADVSYFQASVDDSYPYEILSFRSNDGTFHDPNFAANYEWACKAADSGRIACFIVYFYWRPNWADTVNTHRSMVEAFGGPHPKMISMIDLESGGNPGGDQSDGINRSYWNLAEWLGNPKRVIGYANTGDFNSMWRTRPDGLRVIGAGYGQNPNLPGQIAHQYTDGQGYGGGLPEGCPPFGNCDMNAANGLTAAEFAAACGIKPGGDMQASDPIDDAYGNPSTVGELLKWASYHADLAVDALGGPGSRQGLPGTQKMTGHPELGGHDIVGALALIGQHLGIPGFGTTKAV